MWVAAGGLIARMLRGLGSVVPPDPMPLDSWRKPALVLAGVTGSLLLVPALAMRYTREVDWAAGDFIVAAVLLYGAGLACVLLTRRLRRPSARVAAIAGVLIVLAGAWAQLAVGIL